MTVDLESRLLLDPRPGVGLCCVALAFPGPDSCEKEGEFGWSGLLFELLRAGAGRVEEEIFSDAFDRWGSGLRAITTPAVSFLVYDCLPEFLEESLHMLFRVFGEGSCPDRLLAREKAARVSTVRESYDDPANEAVFRVRKTVFGETSLAVAPLGLVGDLESVSAGRMDEFADRSLDLSQAWLAVSGDHDSRKLRERIGQILPRDESGSPPGETGMARPAGRQMVVNHGKEQSVVVQGFPAVGLGDSGMQIQNLVASCLNGLAGPLFEEVRERYGLAYYSGARLVAGVSAGLFSVVSGCNRAKADFLADRVGAIFERIRTEGFSEVEWGAGLAQARSGLLISRQRVGWRALRLAFRGVLGLEADLGESDELFFDSVEKGQVLAWCENAFSRENETRLLFLGK